jgi:Holliday junction DNA helicase RuvB
MGNPYLRDDALAEEKLRPASFDDFIGQKRVVDNLRIALQAARERGESLSHVLFSGLPGVGKTTLAQIIASEMKSQLTVTSGPILKRPGDLVGLLTKCKARDVLFIDEIHRISADVEEYLYSAMEDYFLTLHIDKGAFAKSVNLPLEKFTLVGATTREGLLSEPFRSRFGLLLKLEFYPQEEVEAIVRRTARLMKVQIEPAAVTLIAQRSRGIPRIANRHVQRVRDLAQVRRAAKASESIAREALDLLGVDEFGLEEIDRKILRTLMANGDQPVGIKTLSVAVGEEEQTIEEVYEPYLIRQHFVTKTPRGRKATERAFEYLGKHIQKPGELF